MPYFVVIRERTGAWDWSRPMREQTGWQAHATFMDSLVADGSLLVGGPLGNPDRAPRVLHVCAGEDAAQIERRLAEDPWTPGLLRTVSIEPWTVLLGKL
jgi:uncharacterized protein YciI